MLERKLNPQQKKAVVHESGPLLIIAGAGTGKTTVITERIHHLIVNKHVSASHLLALTFTEKAAYEMQERVDVLLPYGYTDLWIHTFHGFCDRILRSEAHLLGLDANYRLMSKSESLLLLQQSLFELELKIFKPRSNPLQFLDNLYNHFSRLKDEDITPEQYLQYVQKIKTEEVINTDNLLEKEQYAELANAYKIYEELKVKNSVMDFSDLISNTLLLFRTRKNIQAKYQKQFEYILIDEFQDTNYAQNELAILLAGESKNITVVADDDQSIYRFRGAAVSNVLQFKKKFPNALAISLTQNYRSTQTILDSAYQLIQNNNPNRLEIIEHIDKKLQSSGKSKGKKIEVIHTMDNVSEAEKIVKEIEKLLATGYEYNDFAILVRANNHAQPVIAELQKKKMPFQFLGPEYLFQQEEIKDLIAYLFFLTNVSDSVSLFRILSMDIFNVSALELNYLLNFAKQNNTTLFETLKDVNQDFLQPKTQETLIRFKQMVEKHLENARRQPSWSVLYDFLLDSGLLNVLRPTNIMSVSQEKRVLNISKFFERIKRFETDRIDSTIYTVAEWLSLMIKIGDSPRSDDTNLADNAITITTVHSSKGLEFRVVFLINLVSDRFPSRDRAEKIPIPEKLLKEHISEESDFHMEEERRLFYVGMTRAKELLYFTWAKFYGEGKRIKKISPFVTQALPTHVTKELDATEINKLPIDALFEYKTTERQEKIKEPFKVKKITFSNIQTFNVCPLHYKAQVIFNIPTPPTSNQSMGISIHNALYSFYKKVQDNTIPTKKDLLTILQEQWIHEGFQNKKDEEENFEIAKTMLSEFYEKECHPPVKPLALELPFSFTLKNGVKVSGKIDRIDKTENGIEIIDYKTGEYNVKAKDAHEQQLAMYALAATRIKDPRLNFAPEHITLSIYFLKGNEKKPITLTKKSLEEYEEELIETVEKIEKSNFACSQSPRCASCEYFMLCSTIA